LGAVAVRVHRILRIKAAAVVVQVVFYHPHQR
jgi:hypothetical protein